MKIVVFIENGIVQEVISDHESEIRIIDCDIEGLEESEIQNIEGREVYVYNNYYKCQVDKRRIEKIYKEIEENEEATDE